MFAVVSYHPHQQKVGSFLRYASSGDAWQKVDTAQANRLLSRHHPQYLFKSKQFDAEFHAVNMSDVVKHHRPEQRLKALLATKPQDEIEQKLHKLITILVQFGVNCDFLGLTGSMLIGQQKKGSDIDLVVYGRQAFHQTRDAVKQAVASGLIEELDLSLMKDNFNRRGGDLNFDDFAWHESRKFNKAAIDGTKFDIGMVCLPDELEHDHHHYIKQGVSTVKAVVIDDHRAFDFPARYLIDNEMTPEVVSFTHTYVGQAIAGETIEVSGAVECDSASGQRRLVVGSTREAIGEYIKVCR
ncbi:nucleotidyltransferase domain-containing protein [Methylophaga thiooxydans]|uniref:nucleotidyltransferase domain-containing protein n=1 Tax=Methylophaga thiooxydans TaxID=392484 RepID=UPI0023526E48|nr:nucleotidyltransferase domain-containing protein [Methylophaga thiooxydans]